MDRSKCPILSRAGPRPVPALVLGVKNSFQALIENFQVIRAELRVILNFTRLQYKAFLSEHF